jgi:Zn-finger nucleic acid-binding protein
LVIGDRSGVEIDYCKSCRGIWLDAGELDKIIDRASQFTGGANRANDDRYDRRRESDDDNTWWGRIMDIFD